jgi:phosphonate transport system substrate-binding protein
MRVVIARFVAALVAFVAALPHASAQDDELTFGIYPYLTPTQIVEQFTPLKEYIGKTLGRPVAMLSAPDFTTFIERTRKGEYDVIFTAPHMGRLAEKRDGYRRVAQTGYQIVVVVLVRRDSPIRWLDDLHARSIAIGSRNSMTYQVVAEALRRRGLGLGQDVRLVETASFSNVLQAVMRGEAEAGGTGTLLWDGATDEQRDALRVVFQSGPVPGFLVMAHPRLGEAGIRRLQQALPAFGSTSAGVAYFRQTLQTDFRPLDDAAMKRIDPYVADLTRGR